MRMMTRVLVLTGLLCLNFVAHAENGCPPGMIPYTGMNVSSCGPIPPGYYKNNQSTPATPKIRWASEWGAIATDEPDGILGSSSSMSSQADAEAAALADCKAKGGINCKLETWFRNGCAALVVGNDIYNVTTGTTLDEAKSKGLEISSAASPNCQVYYSTCSLPERIQ